MAVASGRAGRVLARPHFRRLNVHMRTLNTCQAEPSGKTAAGVTGNLIARKYYRCDNIS